MRAWYFQPTVTTSATWDAIVIGSGLGSLAAAAACANRGRRVLVLERLGGFGGAATVYRHGAMTMEASLHETDGDTVFGPHSAFARLGLTGELQAIDTGLFYEARGGALTAPVRIPAGLEAAHEALVQALPAARTALDAYFHELQHLYHSLRDLEEMGSHGPTVLLGMLFSGRLLELIGDARRTLAVRFDALFGADEAVKFALGAPLSYLDDDPAKLSFLLYAGVWARYVESGSYYFKGGSRALTQALLRHVRVGGGDARLHCTALCILLDEQGHAAGVTYLDQSGERIEAHAPLVFAGAAPAAVATMLPEAKRADFALKFATFEPSISLFNISLGLTRPAADFGVAAYSTFIFPDSMQRFADFPAAAAVFGRAPAGIAPPYVIADYGRLDTGLRQHGDLHLLSLCGVDRLAWWDGLDETAGKARGKLWADALIADVDRHFPGFAGAVSQIEIATARTMQAHLGTPAGEVYGFRPTPSRLFGQPPSAATSIKGLWISSAYTMAGGYSGAMQGGLMAADAAARSQRHH